MEGGEEDDETCVLSRFAASVLLMCSLDGAHGVCLRLQ